MAWLYVPVPEGSSLVSTSPSPDTEVCATSSGKVTPRPLSWRGWKSRPWVRLLSGTTLPPSTAARGVASWISSLRVSRASRSALPGSSAGPTTSDGSGRTSSASFGKFNPDGSFSKTSLDLFGTDSDPSSVDWPRSGSLVNGICSARQRSARPTSVSGSSFSPNEGTAWTTPAAADTGSRETKYAQGGTPLTMQSQGWPTPITGGANSKREERGAGGADLQEAARGWPTPRAEDSESSGARKSRGVEDTLTATTRAWPIPSARDWKDTTPLAPRSEGEGAFAERKDQLPRLAQSWPTPTSSDANGTRNVTSGRREGSEHHSGTTMNDAIRSSHPALTISTCGPECSPKHRRLNPAFVEMLMGWPTGWSIARIGSGPSETAWSLYRRRMRYALSRLVQDGS